MRIAALRGDRPPLIGLSTSEMRRPERVRQVPEGEPPMREIALGLAYPEAIERAGGLPVVLPPLSGDADALLDRLDGLLLPGGPDLDPRAYGEEPHPALGPTECDLDLFELALARRADARGMPVLALCRGLQVLNVARGGTLVQDLPDAIGTDLAHRQEEPGRLATHAVAVEPGTHLARVLGAGEHMVNSFHHQAVKALGARLAAVAWAPDGTIEAIEAVDREFVLGVQWHAEALAAEPDHLPLFSALIAAARRFAEAPVARAATSP